MSRLPSLPYISDRVEGRLRTASHFYDPFVPLFVSLIDDDEFPAAPFHLPEWREFNKTAGIKNECRSASGFFVLTDEDGISVRRPLTCCSTILSHG